LKLGLLQVFEVSEEGLREDSHK